MTDSNKITTTTTTTIKDLKLVQLYENNLNDVMQFLMKHFIPNEPTARSVRMSFNDGWEITEAIVRNCLKFPYSYALKNEDDEIVAVRLAEVIERPKLNETNKCENDRTFVLSKEINEHNEKETEKMAISAVEINRLLKTLESKIWHLVATSTKKLLAIMIISTHEKYTRRGLMRELLTFDLLKQKCDGIQGGISEATAYNSQKLFAELGFEVLYQINYNDWLDRNDKQIFKCDDRTNCAQLVHRLY
ncbi:unnamed protein product [Cercopithifilaria johnstoni]|uniref:aralkylamine N-acetyltransferase n=1 Tax=Cercopithifilaria johnstoni TaxID=2874296 RepID=A0A8J2M604_9BILA|nr:unnamed protein product [Cercopithifilaria johnstoni]